MITTYAELKTAAANWLDRTDLTDRISEFITIAEAEFNRRIRTLDMLTRDDAFSVASQRENMPTGYLGAKTFTLDRTPAVYLKYLTPDRLSTERQRFPSSGVPIYFTVIGSSFEFLPTPSDTFTASLLYFKRLTALSDAATSNWLLTSHPDLYLYGTLKAAEPFIMNDERLAVWSGLFEQGLAQLTTQDARASRGVPTMRGRSF